MSKTAKQLMTEMIRSRDAVQHEAAILSFVGRLGSMMPDEVLTVHEVLGPMAALIALGYGLQSKQESRTTRTARVDELGNTQYIVDIADHISVTERVG